MGQRRTDQQIWVLKHYSFLFSDTKTVFTQIWQFIQLNSLTYSLRQTHAASPRQDGLENLNIIHILALDTQSPPLVIN